MSDILLLFDVDGTLIRGSGSGRAAYKAAIEACTGVPVSVDGIPMGGKTDYLILREILLHNGLDPYEMRYDHLVEVYVKHLEEAVQRQPGTVCPGVEALLDRLARDPGIRLALGTGNIERGARIKLAPHGLNGYFETGGFGSDALTRPELIAAGIAKAERRYRTRFQRVVVIGDTPLDVDCAQANGIPCIGVATGSFGTGALREAGAAAVLDDLGDADRFLAHLNALAGRGRQAG